MKQTEIEEKLNLHRLWLKGDPNGQKASLKYQNLQFADFRFKDLRHIDFSFSDLKGADFRFSKMEGCNLDNTLLFHVVGNMEEIKSLNVEHFTITYTSKKMFVGCEGHDILEWWTFNAKRVDKMQKGFGKFWMEWKPTIKQIVEKSPATPSSWNTFI